MSRPDRWWRPSTTRRPAQRARQRRLYSEQEMGAVFDTGYQCGQGDERKRPGDTNVSPGAEDLLDVADAAGVTPPGQVLNSEQLVDEVEAWLREREGDG